MIWIIGFQTFLRFISDASEAPIYSKMTRILKL